MIKEKSKRKNLSLTAAAVPLGIFFAGIAIRLACGLFAPFADLWNSTVGAFIRFILANIFALFPFSFAELLLFSSPAVAAVFVRAAIRGAKKGKKELLKVIFSIVTVAAVIYFLFAAGFAPGYRTTPLMERLALQKTEVNADSLYKATLMVIEELNEAAEDVTFAKDGSSITPHTISSLSENISKSYDSLEKDYGIIKNFPSKVKPLIISPLMTYTHISGIYSFFTGEANINTNYPDFVVAFTAAHEMAHQRGIAREEEANFAAFLAMRKSEDSFLRYAALLNIYEYLSDSLYETDRDLWQMQNSLLAKKAKGDLLAYSAFFDKYRDSTASRVADEVNDAYLEGQGNRGTVSYGLVTHLAVAFYLNDK